MHLLICAVAVKRRVSETGDLLGPGILPIINPGSKRFLGWNKHRRLNLSIKVFSCDCHCGFAKYCSKNRYNLPRTVVVMYNWSNLNMKTQFEPKKIKSSLKESLAQIVASCTKLPIFKVIRETTQNGPTMKAKFNPLHLSQTKNLLDLGLIYG